MSRDKSADTADARKLIRNSTVQFLIFTGQRGEQAIEARYDGETIWLTQKLMATLFDVTVPTINEHLKNIYDTDEISREVTIRKFRTVQTEGNRKVAREVDFYNLDAIISVGYRVNSVRATQFRIWATGRLREYLVKGFTLDDLRHQYRLRPEKRTVPPLFPTGTKQDALGGPWPHGGGPALHRCTRFDTTNKAGIITNMSWMVRVWNI